MHNSPVHDRRVAAVTTSSTQWLTLLCKCSSSPIQTQTKQAQATKCNQKYSLLHLVCCGGCITTVGGCQAWAGLVKLPTGSHCQQWPQQPAKSSGGRGGDTTANFEQEPYYSRHLTLWCNQVPGAGESKYKLRESHFSVIRTCRTNPVSTRHATRAHTKS